MATAQNSGGVKKLAVGLVLFLTFALFVAVTTQLRLHQMKSSSMEPLIHGESRPGASDGDYCLVWKGHKAKDLRRGDLVVVTFKVEGQIVKTVRRVEYVPGDVYSDSPIPNVTKVPSERFYVSATATNGLDSSTFGLVPVSQINGKLVKIFHSQ